MIRRALRIGLWGLGVLLVLGFLVAVSFSSIVRWAMTPRVPFDPARVPAAPDYADARAWSALPGQVRTAELALPGLPAIDPARAAADVFYVHPTTHVGPTWNGAVDDPAQSSATDRVATRLQASAFGGCCAVYAPRYRQATGAVFTRPTPDGQRAIELAYQDVSTAFRHYLDRYNHGRPFFLVAHSQGSAHALRLLREQIAGRPLRAQLVAAYLVGWPISRALAARDLADVPVCATPEQTGCLVSWNARAPKYQPGDFEIRELPREGEPPLPASPTVCVNPLTFHADDAAAAAAQNQGAVFLEEAAPRIQPGFADAQCVDGTLTVTTIGARKRDLASRLLDRALGPGNYHPIEYQIFFMNIRNNAQQRLNAFLIGQARPKL